MKNNLTILTFNTNQEYYTIYNNKFKLCLELLIKKNIINIISNDFNAVNFEISMSNGEIKIYYKHIEYLLSKDPIILDMHLRIILTKLNILNEDS